MKYLAYILFRFTVFLFSILPFKAVYILSNILSFGLLRIMKYRVRVVNENLDKSSLNLNPEQKSKLLKRIYRNLSDVIVEGIKGNSLRSKEISKRYKIANPELLEPYFIANRDFIVAAPHYCNWEWGARALPQYLKHKIIGIYKPLSNTYINNYVKTFRTKDNSILIPMTDAGKSFDNKAYKPGAYILISDQNPSNPEAAIWTQFLGRKTAVIRGPEKYALKYKLPVFYASVKRLQRGYYEVKFQHIWDGVSAIKEGEITARFMNELEKVILKEPANWLWTHKRWKHKWDKKYKETLISFNK
jgi:KDO2-lipid IV(A) lauroyltransferase